MKITLGHIARAKALYRDKNELYIAKGYKIYHSHNDGKDFELDGMIEDGFYTLIANTSRLLSRLLRIEPATMLLLDNGNRVLSAKKGIFLAQKGSKHYRKTFDIVRGNKPLHICKDKDGVLYFGEYVLNGRFADTVRSEVSIYKSEDHGKSWQVCYTFKPNTIRHIHGVFYDKYTDRLWVATGDRDEECIIAYSDDKFQTLNVFKQGAQRYRAVSLLFYEDFILYGTDTEHEQNYIYKIERESGKETALQALHGSVMASEQAGESAIISTAVEPSSVNHHQKAHIWYSNDGTVWHDVFSAPKDRWHPRYFQYGRITFPTGALYEKNFYFSGHALQKIDNAVLHVKL